MSICWISMLVPVWRNIKAIWVVKHYGSLAFSLDMHVRKVTYFII